MIRAMKSIKRVFAFSLFAVMVTACNSPTSSDNNPTNTTDTSPPAKDGQSVIKLSWAASSGSPTGYDIESSTDGSNFTPIQTVTTTSTQVSGLTRGRKYYFRIRAVNTYGDSYYAPMVSVNI